MMQIRFGASVAVESESVTLLRGNDYAKGLQGAVEKHRDAFTRLPENIVDVLFVNPAKRGFGDTTLLHVLGILMSRLGLGRFVFEKDTKAVIRSNDKPYIEKEVALQKSGTAEDSVHVVLQAAQKFSEELAAKYTG